MARAQSRRVGSRHRLASMSGPQVSTDIVLARIERIRALATEVGVSAVLVSPGPDLRYIAGYDAVPLERLTLLMMPMIGQPVMVVPHLEELAAAASPAGRAGVRITTWRETEDPYALVARELGDVPSVALDNHMWAEKVLRLRDAMPGTEQTLAGALIDRLRMVKDEAEIAALTRAAAAIDRVHAKVPSLLRPGRSEREVGADIADLILAEGHVTVDFVIVASGPNGASPHHEVSDRVLETGDAIVVDIGGMMPDGYRSDCTRTYALGDPGEEFRQAYAELESAQALSVAHVRPGVTCASVDSVGRDRLAQAGLGDLFIHRTGHGIGLETHEAPYIVEGNDLPLEAGMAFSVEPGFYRAGRHGARIEDIVVVGESGPIILNHQPRHLVTIP